MKNKTISLCLFVLITVLLLFSSATPFVVGDETIIPSDVLVPLDSTDTIKPDPSPKLSEPAWPMFGYNQYNTGRSPYSTENVTGIERWRYDIGGNVMHASPVIDSNNDIYIGVWGLYAIHSNGTLKWHYDFTKIYSAPAIDENLGVVYVGPGLSAKLYAIYLNNGTLKWLSEVPAWYVRASPVVGPDSMIYCSGGEYMHAIYPENGTEKWKFQTGEDIYSAPALSDDGILYFGSHDHYVYALWAENGRLIWTFNTGNWVHGAPAIGYDGTVYIGSDDGYLYALYPNNGTVKWQTWYGGMWAAPAIDDDGNLYFGVHEGVFYGVYPDGSEKWSFQLEYGDAVWGSSAAISADGTIYFGNCIDYSSLEGGEIVALGINGNLKWRKQISTKFSDSSPAIDSDGNVYIGSAEDMGGAGYLHAFGPVESNEPPNTPTIDGPTTGQAGDGYTYTFSSNDPDNNPVGFFIDWGDGETESTIDFEPGENIYVWHIWEEQGTYLIACKARDSVGAESDWAYLEVSMPLSQQYYGFPLIQKILKLFPNAFPVLRQVLGV